MIRDRAFIGGEVLGNGNGKPRKRPTRVPFVFGFWSGVSVESKSVFPHESTNRSARWVYP